MYVVRISENTKAVRTNEYNEYNGKFNEGYPVVSTYSLIKPVNTCVFKSGSNKIFFSKTFKKDEKRDE